MFRSLREMNSAADMAVVTVDFATKAGALITANMQR
jgi:hypothetical protein